MSIWLQSDSIYKDFKEKFQPLVW